MKKERRRKDVQPIYKGKRKRERGRPVSVYVNVK
jgi:hypothetical protein